MTQEHRDGTNVTNVAKRARLMSLATAKLGKVRAAQCTIPVTNSRDSAEVVRHYATGSYTAQAYRDWYSGKGIPKPSDLDSADVLNVTLVCSAT